MEKCICKVLTKFDCIKKDFNSNVLKITNIIVNDVNTTVPNKKCGWVCNYCGNWVKYGNEKYIDEDGKYQYFHYAKGWRLYNYIKKEWVGLLNE